VETMCSRRTAPKGNLYETADSLGNDGFGSEVTRASAPMVEKRYSKQNYGKSD
jgi:hypothetical protein